MTVRFPAMLAAISLFTILAAPAGATAVRTFVSGKGNDSGSCTLIAPCRTFTFALGATSSGGEIVVLDSAGYGAVTITKPITISNQTGVEGGITVNSGDAVTISLANFGVVTLKGLTIDGAGTATHGIEVASAAVPQLNIVNCTVRNFASHGLDVIVRSGLLVTDSTFIGNGGDGIYLAPASLLTRATMFRVVLEQNAGNGIELASTASGSVQADITEADASNNSGRGLYAAGGNVSAVVRNSVLHFNSLGDLDDANTSTGGMGVFILSHNLIGALFDNGTMFTDRTNTVLSPNGSTPTALTAN